MRSLNAVGRIAPILTGLALVAAAGRSSAEGKVFEVRATEVAPAIDGFIEETWAAADSAYDFFQLEPHPTESPSEKSVVYALQDDSNLYLALRCYADSVKPVACLTSDEDWIAVGIDPFGSRNTAYYFIVYASGIRQDGWVLDDGRSRDDSWEGVWYRGVGLYDDRWEIELKIPFKSIRYRKDLHEWGVQFVRYSAENRETDFWTEVQELEPDMVSSYGTLRGVDPRAAGHYFEFYPEAFVRYDQYAGEKGQTKPRLSLNLKWDTTPQTTVSATAYPDFAQIESDPFTLNLSQYPTYFGERRPFFIEGADIFRMSNFGDDRGFFHPLNIFYSRRIGKLTDGEAVPIIGGLKVTSKSRDWNLGALGAYTDQFVEDDSLIEPDRGFGVLRLRHRRFENSEIGLLLSGTMANEEDYNYALGLDGVVRGGLNQFILQGAASDRSGKKGWGVTSGYWTLLGDFILMGAGEVVDDSFDVSDIGFTPWSGRKTVTIGGGPFVTFTEGLVRNFYCGANMFSVQEPGQDRWSTIGSVELNPHLRNGWSLNLTLSGGRAYEADTSYFNRSANFSAWGSIARQYFNCGAVYSHTYNYRRAFLADQASGWFRIGYGIIPQISTSLQSNAWAEWDPGRSLLSVTTLLRPRIDCRFNADMNASVFNEFVFETQESAFKRTRLSSNRIGFIFAWNFSPKSWLYVAFNDHRVVGENEHLELSSSVGAVKAKYLIYF
jgi:hypothetical protein